MGDGKVERPIFEIIHNAFSSELMQNGYHIVNTGEDFTITGKILTFGLAQMLHRYTGMFTEKLRLKSK